MTDDGTFDCLNRWFGAISRRNDFDFGAVSVSVLIVGTSLNFTRKSMAHIRNMTSTRLS